MKFEVVQNILISPLTEVNGIIEKKSPQPILQHILLEAKEDKLHLLGTDTEITLATELPAKVEEAGKTTISSETLTQLISQLPDQANIHFHLENEQLFVSSGKSQFQLQTLPAEDYPIAQRTDKTGEFAIDALNFARLLDKVRFSMAKNDMRHYLNGLQLAVEGKNIEAVATDGHRLSLASSELNAADNVPNALILPSKAVKSLLENQLNIDKWHSHLEQSKLASSNVDELNEIKDRIERLKELKKLPSFKQAEAQFCAVTLNLGERELSLDDGIYRLTTRLIDGKYPDYHKIIPSIQDNPIQIERKTLHEALKRNSVVLTRTNETGGILEFKGHSLTITTRNNENELAEEHIDILNPADLEVRIGLNVAYLIEVADAVEGERLQLHIQSADGPVLITCEEEPALKYVIMPMRI